MAETQPRDEFEHHHNDCIVRLLKEKALIEADMEALKTPALQPIDRELVNEIDHLLKELAATAQIEPQEVFKKAMAFLPKLDAKRLVIDNILESLKRGESLPKIYQRYRDLGLLSPESGTNVVEPPPTGLGTELIKRKGFLRRIGIKVGRIAINALKSIPKWIEIKPTITFVGPIPALGFVLEGKGMSVQDLLDTLAEGVS